MEYDMISVDMNPLSRINKLRILPLFSITMCVAAKNTENKYRNTAVKANRGPLEDGNKKNKTNRHNNSFNASKASRIAVNINRNNEQDLHRIESIESKIHNPLKASILLAINETIKKSALFAKIEREYSVKRQSHDDYYNSLLLIHLIKRELFEDKYSTRQEIDNGLDMHNIASKLKFTFQVRKIHVTNRDDVEFLSKLLKMQQSSDFDVDKFAAELEPFINKFDKQEIIIPYDEMDFVPNIAHRKVPDEYREAQQLLKVYKYFIFAREKKVNGTYVYYVITGLQEGAEVSLEEFIKLEENRLFYQWLIDILKKNDTYIDGVHIMKYIDDEVAKAIFKAD